MELHNRRRTNVAFQIPLDINHRRFASICCLSHDFEPCWQHKGMYGLPAQETAPLQFEKTSFKGTGRILVQVDARHTIYSDDNNENCSQKMSRIELVTNPQRAVSHTNVVGIFNDRTKFIMRAATYEIGAVQMPADCMKQL